MRQFYRYFYGAVGLYKTRENILVAQFVSITMTGVETVDCKGWAGFCAHKTTMYFFYEFISLMKFKQKSHIYLFF